MKKIRFNEDSFLIIKKQETVKFRNPNGQIVNAVKVTKQLAEGEVNLGSFANPNKNIVAFEYQEKYNPENSFFSNLFKS